MRLLFNRKVAIACCKTALTHSRAPHTKNDPVWSRRAGPKSKQRELVHLLDADDEIRLVMILLLAGIPQSLGIHSHDHGLACHIHIFEKSPLHRRVHS